MDIFLSVVYNLAIVILLVSIIAFGLTKMLNPTATVKEILQHWGKTFNEGR